MKKLLILSLIVLVSCDMESYEKEQRRQQDSINALPTINGWQAHVEEFDSCEYVVSGPGTYQMMSHKGNCKYCKSRKQDEK